jgi:hypothetical protein
MCAYVKSVQTCLPTFLLMSRHAEVHSWWHVRLPRRGHTAGGEEGDSCKISPKGGSRLTIRSSGKPPRIYFPSWYLGEFKDWSHMVAGYQFCRQVEYYMKHSHDTNPLNTCTTGKAYRKFNIYIFASCTIDPTHVPDQVSVNCLEPGLYHSYVAVCMCEGGGPCPALSPKRLPVEIQQQWRKLVQGQPLLLRYVVLQSPAFDRVMTF